ncbi:hypothetical protein [Photobacterium carnosum]|jgi:alkyl hydroperoxide reductase subunit D|uniref:hypothetical protein n=1 Tax=Photobacterium carnosum TaxID=2023717 RepID=UPI001C90FBBE|nr:hypothetical protein [Photobacterium carnosum]MBY3787927.1 hypothetical protein [Photobacterium carnosum]MCD9498822.1 hypothetical protein [Photobacterium carnosum]MCD9514362.1 hypothetical protein [Photobacterium carnosum]MCD9530430.1 hypothetical protein [Photobacterium carnosum]MCD9533104.1 hypothetical protein [Photobacterium carnosum]
MPVIDDQIALLSSLLTKQTELNNDNLIYAAWAAALNSQSKYLVEYINKHIKLPDEAILEDIEYAISRMGVTNPYFIARQFIDIKEGGSLKSLHFRPLQALNIKNETAYHYACVVVSLMNGGYICLSSHVNSLLELNETEKSIDAAMRLGSVCSSLSKRSFIDDIVNNSH